MTAQIPLSALHADPDLDMRFMALCHVLVAKGVITEAELGDALKQLTEPAAPEK